MDGCFVGLILGFNEWGAAGLSVRIWVGNGDGRKLGASAGAMVALVDVRTVARADGLKLGKAEGVKVSHRSKDVYPHIVVILKGMLKP